MNTELFIAGRLYSGKGQHRPFSMTIINIALAGIALGMALILVAVAVVTGFKKEIGEKVIGFGSHVQIVNYDTNTSYETSPVMADQRFLPALRSLSNIESVQVFATKPGIIKTSDYIQGVVLKGVDSTYNWRFFSGNLVEGRLPFIGRERSPEVIVSRNLCSLLSLKLNDPLYMFFINEDDKNPRIRQFTISGIYNTNLQEFDDLFVLGDIRQVQHVNGWDSAQVSGFEIRLRHFDLLDVTSREIKASVTNYGSEPGTTLRMVTIKEKYPQIFDWLSILDMNVWVILILMLMVAGFNMISALLVLILERSHMIGTLKALGSSSFSISKVFVYISGFLISRGLLWGNILGICIVLIQKYFKLIKLDPASYFMDIAPVHITIPAIVLLNAGALIIILLLMVLPALFVSRISPDKVLRFD